MASIIYRSTPSLNRAVAAGISHFHWLVEPQVQLMGGQNDGAIRASLVASKIVDPGTHTFCLPVDHGDNNSFLPTSLCLFPYRSSRRVASLSSCLALFRLSACDWVAPTPVTTDHDTHGTCCCRFAGAVVYSTENGLPAPYFTLSAMDRLLLLLACLLATCARFPKPNQEPPGPICLTSCWTVLPDIYPEPRQDNAIRRSQTPGNHGNATSPRNSTPSPAPRTARSIRTWVHGFSCRT